MAPRQTPRLHYIFPDFQEDPWFENIAAFFLGVDGTNWATSEDRNLSMTGGGTLLLDAGGNLLSWTQPILLQTHSVGITWKVDPATLTVLVGQVVWVQVDRTSLAQNPTAVRTVTPNVSNVLVTSDPQRLQDKIVLGFRKSATAFVWRTGCVITDSVPSNCLETGCSCPGGFSDLWVMGDVPPQTPNGVTTVFTTSFAYVPTKLGVYLDGMRMLRGADYSEVPPNSVVFAVPPSIGSKIQFDYFKT